AGAVDERRPEDGEGNAARPHELLGFPLGCVIGAPRAGPGAEGALVKEMAYSRLPCRFEKVLRTLDVNGPECGAGRLLDDAHEMDHSFRSFRRLFKRGLVGYIALDDVNAQVPEPRGLVRVPDHCAHGNIALAHAPDEVGTDKTGAAGHEYHEAPPYEEPEPNRRIGEWANRSKIK